MTVDFAETRRQQAAARIDELYDAWAADPDEFYDNYAIPIEIDVSRRSPNSKNVSVMRSIASHVLGKSWDFRVMEIVGRTKPMVMITGYHE